MKAEIRVNPGICKFDTIVTATSEDRQTVAFTFETECQTVIQVADKIKEITPINAIMTLGPDENPIMTEFREALVSKGCCEACVVPSATLKGMQIVTGLALPFNVSMEISTESD